MVELVVILLELDLPSCCVGANFMGFAPISEVAMVCPDDYGDGGAVEEVGPVTKSTYDSQEFSIKDFVVSFGRDKVVE